MFKKPLCALNTSVKSSIVIAALIALLGAFTDDDQIEISTALLFFEYSMMTLIIFTIIHTSKFLIQCVFSMLRNF